MKRSQVIYTLLLVLILCVFVALPLIEIDVFTSTPGMIRTESEPVSMRATATGIIEHFPPKENSFVQTGDTLLVIHKLDLYIRDSLTNMRLDSVNVQIEDLRKLVSSSHPEPSDLKSPLMQTAVAESNRSLIRHERTLHLRRVDFLRQKQLYSKGVIALVDLENSRYQYERSVDEMELVRSGRKRRWRDELKTQVLQRQDLLVMLGQIREAQRELVLVAPVSGYVQHLTGLKKGVHVREGAPVLEIIPESGLIVKCYVSSDEIGLVERNQKVIYRIPALKRLGGGTAAGKVLSISPDVSVKNTEPVYEVRCSLDSLPSESSCKKEPLKNGMTLIARFRLARRTVFDLLVDDLEDIQNNFS
jgi:HlyD family secretion protein